MEYLFIFLLGVVVGMTLISLIKASCRKVKRLYHIKKANYFLTHQIDYYRPIEKGSYPKEEDA